MSTGTPLGSAGVDVAERNVEQPGGVAAEDLGLHLLGQRRVSVLLLRLGPAHHVGDVRFHRPPTATEAARVAATYGLSRPYFLYVGDYGAELARVDEMTLSGFLDFMFDSETSDPDVCTYRLFGVSDLDGAVGDIIDYAKSKGFVFKLARTSMWAFSFS